MGNNARTAHIANLNGLLADAFALYIKTKNFHWHVRGPQFRDLPADAMIEELVADKTAPS